MRKAFSFALLFLFCVFIVNLFFHVHSMNIWIKAPEDANIKLSYSSFATGEFTKDDSVILHAPKSDDFIKLDFDIDHKVKASAFKISFPGYKGYLDLKKIDFIVLGMPLSFQAYEMDDLFTPYDLIYQYLPQQKALRLNMEGPNPSMTAEHVIMKILNLYRALYALFLGFILSVILFALFLLFPFWKHAKRLQQLENDMEVEIIEGIEKAKKEDSDN